MSAGSLTRSSTIVVAVKVMIAAVCMTSIACEPDCQEPVEFDADYHYRQEDKREIEAIFEEVPEDLTLDPFSPAECSRACRMLSEYPMEVHACGLRAFEEPNGSPDTRVLYVTCSGAYFICEE